MRRLGLIAMILCADLVGRAALANGGGYSFGVKFPGALAPFQAFGTQNVRILEEKLEIDLRRTEAAVLVRYTMQNQSKHPVTVKFGFPVEAQKTDDEEEETEQSPSGKALG